jgi:hypothetical protein
MVTIKVGSSEQQLESLDEGWLLQQIKRRRRDGERVCVIVEIDDSPINLIFPTKGCARGGGSSARAYTAEEQRVIDLWQKHHLDELEFKEGELIAFLKQLRRIVG